MNWDETNVAEAFVGCGKVYVQILIYWRYLACTDTILFVGIALHNLWSIEHVQLVCEIALCLKVLHSDVVPLLSVRHVMRIFARVPRVITCYRQLIPGIILHLKLCQVLEAWHILKINNIADSCTASSHLLSHWAFEVSLLNLLGVIEVLIDDVGWNQLLVRRLPIGRLLYADTSFLVDLLLLELLLHYLLSIGAFNLLKDTILRYVRRSLADLELAHQFLSMLWRLLPLIQIILIIRIQHWLARLDPASHPPLLSCLLVSLDFGRIHVDLGLVDESWLYLISVD